MKIVSRVTQEDENIERLQEIIEAATDGAIGPDGEIGIADNLSGLVTQVDITCASLLETINTYDKTLANTQLDLIHATLRLAKVDAMLDAISLAINNGISYDEDLDHATIDMMEALVASGASEPTFDGEISFRESVIISKEDFKPIVRQAIESWLQLKITKG